MSAPTVGRIIHVNAAGRCHAAIVIDGSDGIEFAVHEYPSHYSTLRPREIVLRIDDEGSTWHWPEQARIAVMP